jgi:hypothetical protein
MGIAARREDATGMEGWQSAVDRNKL